MKNELKGTGIPEEQDFQAKLALINQRLKEIKKKRQKISIEIINLRIKVRQ